MPSGDWIKHPAFGVALFAFLGLGAIPLCKEYQIVRRAEYKAATEHLADANHSVLTRYTPVRDPNPNREEWRNEKDLEAQRQMALWAGLLLIVTTAGVFYVARTLDATHDAVKAANDATAETRRIGEAQVSAYLSIVDIGVIPEGEHGWIEFMVRVRNTGQSPADYLITTFYIELLGASVHPSRQLTHQWLGEIGSGETYTIRMPVWGYSLPSWFIDALNENRAPSIKIIGAITCKNVFGSPVKAPFDYIAKIAPAQDLGIEYKMHRDTGYTAS